MGVPKLPPLEFKGVPKCAGNLICSLPKLRTDTMREDPKNLGKPGRNAIPSILFFLEGRNVPSSRFRAMQYQELLDKSGIKYTNLFTLPSKYLYYPPLIAKSILLYPWAAACLLAVVLTRITQIIILAPFYSHIVLQRDLLHRVNVPFLEALLFGWLKALGRRDKVTIALDVDDAIFIDRKNPDNPALQRKIQYIARNADLVVAGNQYLADYFGQFQRTVLIPTTIDTNKFKPRSSPASSEVCTIGWTGSASNLGFLSMLESVFVDLQQKFQFKIIIVCEEGARLPFSKAVRNVSMTAWSPQNEADINSNFDIGIMPLEDNQWSKGKCGFKIIQYLAAGIPSVASGVGANKDIIEEGVTGFLVGNEDQWSKRLAKLLSSSDLRARMGEAARRAAEERFSRDAWFERWLKAMQGEL